MNFEREVQDDEVAGHSRSEQQNGDLDPAIASETSILSPEGARRGTEAMAQRGTKRKAASTGHAVTLLKKPFRTQVTETVSSQFTPPGLCSDNNRMFLSSSLRSLANVRVKMIAKVIVPASRPVELVSLSADVIGNRALIYPKFFVNDGSTYLILSSAPAPEMALRLMFTPGKAHIFLNWPSTPLKTSHCMLVSLNLLAECSSAICGPTLY